MALAYDRAMTVSVRRGRVIAYRIFDVAEEFDLAVVESVARSTLESSRLSLVRATGHSLVVRNAPVTLTLAPCMVRLGDQRVNAEAMARLWDYGVVSIQFHIPIAAGTSWTELVELASRVEDRNDLDEMARQLVADVVRILQRAAKLPHEIRGMEDYVVYFLERIDGAATADLVRSADIPALILGEPREPLSERLRQSIVEQPLSYSSNDLAVIDWNSAVVVEPAGSRDVADILEFAATHLAEFRYFDELLDERLEKLYGSIEARRSVRTFFGAEYGRLSREANSLYLEFSDYVERVENSLKFVGDFYLATIFRAAVSRFHLRDWEESVTRKLNTLAQISELLEGEVNVRRSHWLEIVVILLILYEIVSAALRFT